LHLDFSTSPFGVYPRALYLPSFPLTLSLLLSPLILHSFNFVIYDSHNT
jgi:hypothetical protein